MNRFWERFIKPIIETVRPAQMLEIGADRGWNTQYLLAYCHQTGAHLSIIDPAPAPELAGRLAQYGPEYTHYPLKSIDAIPHITAPDLALIDGDHNWHTVFSELTLLFSRAAANGAPMPITLFHDIAWPYGRRDMYYNPDNLDPENRHPYAYRGMIPGHPDLVDDGMNGSFANALHEGGPQNGVLTAIEDFIASITIEIRFYTLPFFNGFGVLVPAERMTPQLQSLIDGFFSAESLLQSCKDLERDSLFLRTELARTQMKLMRRTDALRRAQALLGK